MDVACCANYPASQSILPYSQTVTMLLCREQLAPKSHALRRLRDVPPKTSSPAFILGVPTRPVNQAAAVLL
jgi:hypothetical protein